MAQLAPRGYDNLMVCHKVVLAEARMLVFVLESGRRGLGVRRRGFASECCDSWAGWQLIISMIGFSCSALADGGVVLRSVHAKVAQSGIGPGTDSFPAGFVIVQFSHGLNTAVLVVV